MPRKDPPAMHPKYGCGKNYPTRNEAIHGMLSDHGCYNITIEIVQQA